VSALTYKVLVTESADDVLVAIDELDCLAVGPTRSDALADIKQRAERVLQRYESAGMAPPMPVMRMLVPLRLRSHAVVASGAEPLGGDIQSERSGDASRIERALVTQLLGGGRPQPWSRAEFEAELVDADAIEISEALERLAAAEVIRISGDLVYPCPAIQHLGMLGMSAIQ
jgi:hypothetical protein